MLRKMIFTLKLSRPVNIGDNTDYIVPGGYTLSNLKFDFMNTSWKRDDNETNTIHCEVSCIDTDLYFAEAESITPQTIRDGSFTEFFIYTEGDIEPVEVSDVRCEFDDETVCLSDEQIAEINELITGVNKLIRGEFSYKEMEEE